MRGLMLSLLWASTMAAQTPPPDSTRGRESCRVSRVIDGDTFTCTGGRQVRFLEIDAPEGRQHPAGDSATATLQRLIHDGVEVSLEIGRTPTDRYGRTLAFVWLGDSLLINEELVRRGWAVYYHYDNKNPQYDARLMAAEAGAKRARRGWWRTGRIRCFPDEFRRRECNSGS